MIVLIIQTMEEESGRRTSSKRLWTKEEDDLLCIIVARQDGGIKWAGVSEEFNNETSTSPGKKRTNKQCRQRYLFVPLRWQNHLNPILQNSTQWSEEQHSMLFKLFREYLHQWCVISSKLEENGFVRRGDNHIKNYFYSSIKRAIKSINCVVRQNNKAIKKHKSFLYNYHQKYAYKKRLSLQRQIMNHNNDSTSHEQHQQQLPGWTEKGSGAGEMRILKELDQDIVNKILLIAEQKGGKKFAVGNKECKEEAVRTRNRLIDYIQDNTEFKPQDVVELTMKILQISRRCKRRTNKANESEGEEAISSEVHEEGRNGEQGEQEEGKQVEQVKKASQIALSQPALKMQPKQSENKSLEQKKLLQRFLFEDSESENNNEQIKKGFSWSSPSIKMNDQLQNSMLNLFPPHHQPPKIGLDQSNSYLFASNSYSIMNNISYAYDVVNYPVNQSNGLGFPFEPTNLSPFVNPFDVAFNQQQPKPKEKEEEGHANLAEFKFISSIKQIQPKQSVINAQMFDFDLQPNAANVMNPFMQGFIRNDSQQQRLFCSQVASLQRPSSHRSNKSKQKSEVNELGQMMMRSQQLINRSWAYSSSRLQQCINLFNSSNYEGKSKNGVDLRSSSHFHPFSPKEE